MKRKKFKSIGEEAEHWERTLRGVTFPEKEWEEVHYKPRATVAPRQHVYRVRLDDDEMAGLQALAKVDHVNGSTVVRELIRAEVRRRSSGGRKPRGRAA